MLKSRQALTAQAERLTPTKQPASLRTDVSDIE
jgi:hypothetical protein